MEKPTNLKKGHELKILPAILLLWLNMTFLLSTQAANSFSGNVNFQKTYAVIVAISDYQFFPSGPGGDLNFTDDDARKFYQYLVSPTGGHVEPQNVVLLINQAATKNAILKMLDHVFSKAKENDRVIFYFSGHGQAGYLVPSDASDANSLISYDLMKNSFKKCKAKTKICFIDACHSNSIKLNNKQATSNGAQKKDSDAAVVVMVSSQSYQTSMEDGNLKQGAFSYYLLKGLKGAADSNRDKTVTISELHQYVYSNVKKYTFDKQIPHTFGKFDLDMPVAVLK
jgi:uncharacterized caspase-like protein